MKSAEQKGCRKWTRVFTKTRERIKKLIAKGRKPDYSFLDEAPVGIWRQPRRK